VKIGEEKERDEGNKKIGDDKANITKSGDDNL
jgi:hypothetical protein